MNIAICDNDILDKKCISDFLNMYFRNKSRSFEFYDLKSAKNLIYEIEDGTYFDLVFLNIYIGDVLGIDVARKLREIGYDNEIVFLANTADFAVAGYDVRAIGYLLKPFGFDQLKAVMERFVDKCDVSMYQIKQRKSTFRVPYDDIKFVESNNSKCTLHTANGSEYVIYKHLGEIEEELSDNRFLRCHRSYLVNMNYILGVDKQFFLMGGDVVLIRQKSLRVIREKYLDYIAETKDRAKVKAIGEG